jgi:RsiW-degrading membrane proteinase PrsW (M82 family)
VADFSILLFWAIAPPLLFLACYYCRISHVPSLLRLLLFFIFGAISGLAALSLGWVFEMVANQILDWQEIQRTLPGIALRQLVAVGPIEESCKLAAVFFPICYFQRRYRLRPITVFVYTIAVALGFTAFIFFTARHQFLTVVLVPQSTPCFQPLGDMLWECLLAPPTFVCVEIVS